MDHSRQGISPLDIFPRHGIAGPLLLLLASGTVQLAVEVFPDGFLYDRAALVQGQLWRLLSGHLAHSNGAHLLLNAGAVVALWLVHGQHYRTRVYLGLCALISLSVGAGLWLWFPDVELYCGLSGVLHGLFCWGACRDLTGCRISGALQLMGCFAKVAWEQVLGPGAGTAALIEAEVAVSSHLLGAVAGTCAGLLGWPVVRRQPAASRN